MDERSSPGCRRMLIGTVIVAVAMMLCIGVTTIVVDGACYSDMEGRLPIYPNATIKLQQHNFFRQFGMGESVMILHSDVAVEVVRNWYSSTVGGAVYEDVQRGTIRHMGRTNWTVGPDEGDVGSQIILYARCGS